jgi:hypothetical protein
MLKATHKANPRHAAMLKPCKSALPHGGGMSVVISNSNLAATVRTARFEPYGVPTRE